MSLIWTTFSRSLTKNIVLARHAQNFARISTVCQPISVNKYENKFNAAKLDKHLIKSTFSTEASPALHDHSKLWTLERGLSGALIAIVPLAFLTPNPYLDYALALSLVTHIHWGVEAIVIDYIRPRLFGPVIPKISIGLVYLLSALTLAGLYYFNYQDVGLSQAIMMLLKK